jgi:uncharacterized caspase-like protein
MRTAQTLIFALAALILLTSTGLAANARYALVIGNSAYKDKPLKNPANDAGDMARELKRLGFDVQLRTNASLREMEEAIRDFGVKLKRGGVGLFYYAGHGVQVQGVNYLVPVGARLASESDAKYECVDAGRVLGKMEDAGNELNIVILDACRNNPFARSFRSADQGLARMDAPTGSIVAYATAPNSIASDGSGANGLYTKYLLQNMGTPGITIEELFKRVRIGVMGETAKKQVPWESSSISGYFYLAGTPSAGQYGAAQAAGQAAARQTLEQQRQQDQKLQQYIAGLEAEKRQVEQQKTELARLRQQLDADAAKKLQQQQAPQEERLRDQLAVLEAERHKLEQERQELAKARQKAEAAVLQAQQAQAAAQAAAKQQAQAAVKAAPKVASADPKEPLPRPRQRGEDRANLLSRLSGVWRFETEHNLPIPMLSLQPGGDTLYGTLVGDERALRRASLTGLAMEGSTIHVRMSLQPATRFNIGPAKLHGLARGQEHRVYECAGDVNAGDNESFPVVCQRVDAGATPDAERRKESGRMIRNSAARGW